LDVSEEYAASIYRVVEFDSKGCRSETVLTVYEGCKYLWPVVAGATRHSMVTIDSSDWREYVQTIDGVPPKSTSAKDLTKPSHPEDGGSKIFLHF
jgi:hypothetical protein